MKYNHEITGQIIKRERNAAGKSQSELCSDLKENYNFHITRKTLSAIENGKYYSYNCDLLYSLCEIFNCEMGYLLGEYECKTGRNTDIKKETGLNESAIEKLSKMQFINNANGLSDILNLLINHQNFGYLLSALGNNSTGTFEMITFGNTTIQLDRKAILNSELKDTIIEIANDVRKEYKPNEYAAAYNLLYGLYADGSLTLDQVKETEKEYAKGNFEYVPKGFKRKK